MGLTEKFSILEDIRTKQKDTISNILNSNPKIRSKRELIERFINDNLLKIENNNVKETFNQNDITKQNFSMKSIPIYKIIIKFFCYK